MKVKNFLTNSLQIEDIPILDAYRVGKGKYRTIVIHLQNY